MFVIINLCSNKSNSCKIHKKTCMKQTIKVKIKYNFVENGQRTVKQNEKHEKWCRCQKNKFL
jgi:hypothetical protein